MQIAVIGAGYVGLVAAACLADAGHDVALVEQDLDRLAQLHAGDCPIFEPGLPALLQRAQAKGRLSFVGQLHEGLAGARIALLAVGTPPSSDGSVDLSAIDAAIEGIRGAAHQPLVLLIKSTVPVGTQARLQARLREAPHPIEVVSNPEFLREGRAVDDFRYPSRIVIGATDPAILPLIRELYSPFLTGPESLRFMDPASAELSKYAANAMLAARISLINELSTLCEEVGGDIEAVRRVVGADPRIGPHYLQPSIGYGGSCLPKDLAALSWLGRRHGVAMRMVEATAQTNAAQIARWTERVIQAAGGVQDRIIAFWGLSFKAGTDDIRESAPLAVARALRDRGAWLQLHDPVALPAVRQALGPTRLRLADDPWQAVAGADALVLGTEWPDYRAPDLDRLRATMRTPVVLDGRNLLDPRRFLGSGIRYYSLGRPSVR